MKLNKAIAIPAIALAAGISLAACGSTHVVVKAGPTVTHTVTAKPTPVKTKASARHTAPAPAPAAALPTVDTNNANTPGTWAVEPSFIGLSEDGNGDLSGLTWSSWTAYSAKGSGTINVNNGVPNMARGTTVDVAVSVALSSPVNGSFTAMTVTDNAGNENTYGGGTSGTLSPISGGLSSADAASAPEPTPTPTPPVTVGGPNGFGSCGAQACSGNNVAPLPTPGWAPCTTIAGMYPGGQPGHVNPADGFCVADGGTEG